jgi:predicted dehydrogenase
MTTMDSTEQNSDSYPAKVVVVGAGSIGQRHARLWREWPGVQVALCDSDEANLEVACQALPGTLGYRDLSEALSWEPGAVIVATPHQTHTTVSCRAMEAGADVLCEKPMSTSLDESRRMTAVAGSTGRVLRIGFSLRFHPAVTRLRALCEGGRLGTLMHMRYCVGAYETLSNSRSRYQSQLFGALVMDYVHGLDLILWLGARHPSGVYARGIEGGQFPFTSCPNVCCAVLDFDQDRLAEIHMDYATAPSRNSLEIIGDQASVSADLITGAVTIWDRATAQLSEERPLFERDDMFRAQIRDFSAARLGRRGLGCTAEEGCHSTALMEGMLSSLQSGTRVSYEA